MNEIKTSSDIVDALKKASDGLQFMSESDYPFEAFLWEGQAKEPLTVEKLIQQTGHSQDTPVEVVNLNDFFRVATQEPDWYGPEEKETATKYQNLVETLESHLCESQVYRVGTIEIDVYVVGKANGDLIGLSTKVVET